MMERFLFRPVNLWVVILLAIIGLVSMILFGIAVAHVVKGGTRLGPATSVISNIVDTPKTLRRIFDDTVDPTRHLRAGHGRFDGAAGFDFSYPAGTRPDAPYVLLNRYDGDLGKSVSELVDLNTQEVLHSWVFEVNNVWSDTEFDSVHSDLWASYHSFVFRGIHADLAPDGSLVTQGMNTPLLKYGLCGNLEWVNSEHAFHHSIERTSEGTYWVPLLLEPKTVELGNSLFKDSGIAEVTADGEVIYSRSGSQILIDNGMEVLLFGKDFGINDPIHLNDIQPVEEDGEIWRKGDVFLSLRNQSMVLLFRPSTGKIIWHMTGPWLHQHDVNILDDRRISVFDNNARTSHLNGLSIDGTSGVWIVDVTDDSVTPYFEAGFAAQELRTRVEGRARLLDDGNLWVEETTSGRAVAFDADGTPDWSYVNRAGDGHIYLLNWTRIVDRTTGDAVRDLLDAGTCPG